MINAIWNLMARVRVQVDANALTRFARSIRGVQSQFITLGVTTIFLDRLIQSLSRAWNTLNTALGVTRVADQAQAIKRLAFFTGIGTDQLQAFAAVAARFGVEINDVSDLFQTLGEKISDVMAGDKGQTDLFKRFGLTKKNFDGAKGGIQQFLVFSQAVSKLGDNESVAALEKILGGDLARKFGALATEGAAGVIDRMNEAVRLGLVMGKQQLDAAAKFKESQSWFVTLVTSLSNNIGSILIPGLTDLVNLLSDLTGQVNAWIRSNMARYADAVSRGISKIVDGLRNMAEYINKEIMPIGDFVARLAQGLLTLSAIFAAFAGGAIIAKGSILFGLFFSLGVIIDDILTFMRGGKSFIGEFLNTSPALQAFMLGMQLMIAGIKMGWVQFSKGIETLAKGPLLPLLLAAFGGIMAAIGGIALAAGIVFNGFSMFVNLILELCYLIGTVLGGSILEVGARLKSWWSGNQGFFDAMGTNHGELNRAMSRNGLDPNDPLSSTISVFNGGEGAATRGLWGNGAYNALYNNTGGTVNNNVTVNGSPNPGATAQHLTLGLTTHQMNQMIGGR